MIGDRLEFAGFGVVVFLLFAVSSCEKSLEHETLYQPVLLPSAPVTDEFAGKTVVDMSLAQGIVMSRMENAPAAGVRALETEFIDAKTGETVFLSGLIGQKPAVLIFGSGSCSALNVQDYQIERLAKRFSKDLNFHFIYVREAHPAGGFNPQLLGSSAEEKIPEIADAESLEARREIALAFADRAGFSFRALTDTMDDAAAVRWGAWPLRIFVIDRGGEVIYAGDQGPWYFKPVDSYEHAPPPAGLDAEFLKRPFDRTSLAEFLEKQFGAEE